MASLRRTPRRFPSRVLALATVAVALAAAPKAQAQAYVWQGGAFDLWSNFSAWYNFSKPGGSSTTDIYFGRNPYTNQQVIDNNGVVTNDIADNFYVRGLYFYYQGWNMGGKSLRIADGGGISAVAANVSISNKISLDGSTYAVANGGSITLSGAISGAGSLTVGGDGAIALTGLNTYAGGTSVVGGRLVVQNPFNNYTIANNAALEFGHDDNQTFAGVVSGAGSLTKSGFGNLTLTGSNTYSGSTIVNKGTLTSGAYNAVPTSTALTVNGAGTFAVQSTQFVASLEGSGAISLEKGGRLLAGDASNKTFSGIAFGEGTFAKLGSGMLTLSGNGSFSGGIDVYDGILRNGVDGALAQTTPVYMLSGTYDLNGKAQTIGSLKGSGLVRLDPGSGSALKGALTFNTPDGETWTSFTDITGNGSLTKTGAGTQILGGQNTYFGGTTVLNGTLVVSNPVSFFPSPAYTVTGPGILDFRIGSDLTYANRITGTGTFAKSGPATLTFDRDTSYTGGTIVREGTLSMGGNGSIAAGPLTIDSGAAFAIGFRNATVTSLDGSGTVLLGGRSLTIDTPTGVDTTFSGVISGSGSVAKSGVGTQRLSGANTSTASLAVNAGTLVLSGSNAFSSITVNGGTLRNGSSNALQTSKGLTVNAGGTYDLAGFSQSLASIQSAGSVSLGSGVLTINQGSSGTANISGAIDGSGSLTMAGDGVLNLSGLNSYTGGTVVNAGRLIDANPHGGYSLFNSALEFQTGGVKSYAGAVTGQGSLTKSGGGTLTLTGANDYSGGTYVNAGRLVETNAHGQFYTMSSPGILDLAAPTDRAYALWIQGTGGLVKSGAGTLTLGYYGGYYGYTGGTTVEEGRLVDPTIHGNYVLNGSSILESANPDLATTFTGVISGTGTFVKSGSGTLTINTAGGYRNNYTGGTIVNEGTLVGQFNEALPAGGSLTVNAGATYDSGAGIQDLGWISGLGTIVVGTRETNPMTLSLPAGSVDTFEGTMTEHFLGNFRKAGEGTLVLTGSHTHTNTLLDGGRLIDYRPAKNYALASGTVLEFRNAGDASASNVGGAGAVLKKGAGTLLLFGSSNTGGTTVDEGKLIARTPSGDYVNNTALEFNLAADRSYSGKVTGPGTLTKSGSRTLTVSGTDTHLGGYTVTEGLLSDQSPHGDYRLAGGNLQFEVGTNVGYGGLISGTGSLTKYGAGVVTLTQANTYAGKTNIYGGGFSAEVDNALPATTGILFAWGNLGPYGGSSGSWSLNGHHQDLKFLDGNFGNVDLGNGGSITVRSSNFDGEYGDAKMEGTIVGAGSFTMAGDGTQVLRGINTYTGGTTVTSGRLIDWNPHGDYLNDAALEFRPLGDQTYSGVVSGTGSLTKSGTGNMTLAGMDTYTGGTSVLTGRLTVFNPHGAYALEGGTTLEVAKGGDYGLAAPTGAGSLVKSGVGTLTLGGTNPYSGNTAVNAGTLKLGAGLVLSSASSLTVDAGATFDMTDHAQTFASLSGGGSILLGNGALTTGNASNAAFSGVVSGVGSLTKAGAGTLTLAGANTYSGGTTVTAGKLIDANPHGAYVDNAALEFATATDQALAGVVSGTGSLTKTGAGTLVLSGANTYSGGTAVTGGRLVDQSPHGTYALTNAGLELAPSSGLSAASVNGTGSFTKSGAGTLAISGTLGAGIAVSLTEGTLKGSTDVFKNDIVSTGGTLQFDQTVKGGTYAFTYSGSGSILKTGSKPLTMGSVPVNTGGIRVSGGSLGIGEGGAFDGGLTVDPRAAFLNFSGDELTVGGRTLVQGEVNTVGGSTTVFTGLVSGAGAFTGLGEVDFQGGYAPGNSPASVTFQGDVNLSSSLTMELGGTGLGTEYDHLNVLGTASLGGDLIVAYYGGFAPVLGQSFDLFDFDSSNGTFSSVTLPTLGKGLAWNTSMLYTDGSLSVQAVPEPTSLAALGLGALALLRRRRR